MKGKRAFRILFIDGPNLNVLGEREPSVYGRETLTDIRKEVAAAARTGGDLVEADLLEFLETMAKEYGYDLS